MKKFINLLKKKWLINTSKTALLILILIAIFVLINFAVKKMNLSTIDLTENKLYSLTDESKEKIKDIDKTINIYFFGYTNTDSAVNLANQYSKINSNIQVLVANQNDYPELYKKYEVDDTSEGAVVACGDKNKILTSSDFYTYDYSTGESIDTTEQTLTSAILNVITEDKPEVYFLTGHSEELSKYVVFKTFLINELNDVNELDLISSDFPEKCDCLILTTPKSDYSELETTKISNYINNGGNILCLMDSFPAEYVNLQNILNLYGLSISADGLVNDSDTSSTSAGNTSYIIPEISYHDITQYIISDGSIMLMDNSKINVIDDDKLDELNVKSDVLLQSGETSYLSNTKENGPFILGIEQQKTINDKTSKLILYSGSKFAKDSAVLGNQQFTPFTVYSNKDLLLNTVAYLTEKDSSITIRKDTNSVTYTATEKQNRIVLLIIFAFPIFIIAFGIGIGIYRKRRK